MSSEVQPTSSGKSNAKLYVGRLPPRCSTRDLEDLFSTYGRVVSCEVKHAGYAFLEFDNEKDAEDALNRLNGHLFDGQRIIVEWSKKSVSGGEACFNCGKTGHWVRDCPESRGKGMDVRSGKCFKCGNLGHLAKFCRGGDRRGGYSDRRRRSPSPYRSRRRSYSPAGRRYDSRSRSPPRRRTSPGRERSPSRRAYSPAEKYDRKEYDSAERSEKRVSPPYDDRRANGREYVDKDIGSESRMDYERQPSPSR
ncbi:hypothetical protein HK096_010905 [Nowakowskiella sp. JEL0078]|nr:hypothetical protein HK096_010905 [Nowakowskiella sp. JEL0078]